MFKFEFLDLENMENYYPILISIKKAGTKSLTFIVNLQKEVTSFSSERCCNKIDFYS